ncbi:MAG: hypothetical protein VX341_06095 [Bdellovibrionota bacterium]|nr:hypothetical protein [Bdellovibrionota bacterium]
MKLLILTFVSMSIFAADSIIPTFKFSFTMPKDAHHVIGEIVQNCRYEKFVISDSAEYINDYRTYPLKVKKIEQADNDLFIIENNKRRYHEVTGWYKPTKQCNARIEVKLESAIYRAWIPNRAISFSFREQDHYKENAYLDISEIYEQLDSNHMTFKYQTNGGNQVNILLLTNGANEYWPPQSAAKNPATNMPYLIGQ